VGLAATLAAGLRSYSRLQMKMAGMKINLQESLLALIVDKLSVLAWQNTEDGQRGFNYPDSIYKALAEDNENECYGFESGDDFMDKWRAL